MFVGKNQGVFPQCLRFDVPTCRTTCVWLDPLDRCPSNNSHRLLPFCGQPGTGHVVHCCGSNQEPHSGLQCHRRQLLLESNRHFELLAKCSLQMSDTCAQEIQTTQLRLAATWHNSVGGILCCRRVQRHRRWLVTPKWTAMSWNNEPVVHNTLSAPSWQIFD